MYFKIEQKHSNLSWEQMYKLNNCIRWISNFSEDYFVIETKSKFDLEISSLIVEELEKIFVGIVINILDEESLKNLRKLVKPMSLIDILRIKILG